MKNILYLCIAKQTRRSNGTTRTLRLRSGSKTTTSRLTFSIYLVHIAIMREPLWKWDFILGIQNYYLQWAVIVVLTFSLSWMVSYLGIIITRIKEIKEQDCIH